MNFKINRINSETESKTEEKTEYEPELDAPAGTERKARAYTEPADDHAKPADDAKTVDAKTDVAPTPPGVDSKSESDGNDDLKTLSMPDVLKKLGSTKDGLTGIEAAKRLTQYGANEIEQKTENPYLKFLSYFWGPIAWMIEAAVILSAIVRHWLDFGVILLMLFTNAVVGFWEEHQAGNAIAALKKQLATNARVRRDGKSVNPKVAELVPGDVVRIRFGDIVPADARLLENDPIEIDQSALTGESLPVTRKPGEAIFSGSIVRQGETDAIIYATGTKTYFGKTAAGFVWAYALICALLTDPIKVLAYRLFDPIKTAGAPKKPTTIAPTAAPVPS